MRHTRHRRRQQLYRLTFEASLVAALVLCIAAFQSGWRPAAEAPRRPQQPEPRIDVMELPPTTHPETVPPPPRPLVPILVPNDVELPDEDEIVLQPVDVDVPSVAREMPPPLRRDDPGGERSEPFEIVEQMPAPRAGWSAFYGSLRYPEAARRAGVEGRVELQFVVGEDGELREVEVVRSVHPLLDAEAVRALREVQFAPGRQRDRPVPVRMKLPVMFRLRK